MPPVAASSGTASKPIRWTALDNVAEPAKHSRNSSLVGDDLVVVLLREEEDVSVETVPGAC